MVNNQTTVYFYGSMREFMWQAISNWIDFKVVATTVFISAILAVAGYVSNPLAYFNNLNKQLLANTKGIRGLQITIEKQRMREIRPIFTNITTMNGVMKVVVGKFIKDGWTSQLAVLDGLCRDSMSSMYLVSPPLANKSNSARLCYTVSGYTIKHLN